MVCGVAQQPLLYLAGAELISVVNSDENKTFGAVFRTPVSDSTGIPHILEHSVLCGSRKYPIKEPFVELMKGSLNTFLNAFTYPDRTCYPVASTNTQVGVHRATSAGNDWLWGGASMLHNWQDTADVDCQLT